MTARNRASLKADLENGDTFDATIAGDMVDSFLTLEDGTAQTVSGAVTFASKSTHSAGVLTTIVSANGIVATSARFSQLIGTIDETAIAVGSAQATGYLLSAKYTMFTSVSAGQEAALLPQIYGVERFVYNNTANNLKVFPYSGAKIDSQAADAAYVVSGSAARTFIPFNATRVFSR